MITSSILVELMRGTLVEEGVVRERQGLERGREKGIGNAVSVETKIGGGEVGAGRSPGKNTVEVAVVSAETLRGERRETETEIVIRIGRGIVTDPAREIKIVSGSVTETRRGVRTDIVTKTEIETRIVTERGREMIAEIRKRGVIKE